MTEPAEELKKLQEKNQKKKKNERIVMFIVIIAILGLLVGSVIGFQSGYHVALVDFNIIKGVMI